MMQTIGKPRMRDDLVWLRHGNKGLDRWMLQDPSTREFYYFTSLEKDVLSLFSGDKDLGQVHTALLEMKPGCGWSMEKLLTFLQLLITNNLVLCDQYGKGASIAKSVQRKKNHRRYGWLTHPLAIRLPLFRPQNLLKVLQPIERVLFHPVAITLFLIAGIVSLVLAALQWNEIVASLPPIETLIRGDRIILMLAVLAVVKSLHELGHAMACHKYAGTCGEIGIMFLMFTPCLYCDVSPSWGVKNRWQRFMIAMAGIYIELILSLLAVLALLFVPSEVVRANAVYIFMVCTLGTIFLNGNPLVKYDGYFACSDLLGVPNLSDQAREAASYTFLSSFFKSPPTPPTLDCSRSLLFFYWILSTAYRFLLLILILWGINWLLRPLGLEFVAYYIGLIMVTGVAWTFTRSLLGVPDMYQMHGGFKFVNTTVGLCAALALGALVFFWPISDSVKSRATIRFEEMIPVFVQQAGRLVSAQHSEGDVQTGSTIYELKSSEQDIKELMAASEVQATSLKLELRKEMSVIALEDDLQLPTLERTLDIRKRQWASVKSEGEQLSFIAPRAGYWFHALPSFIGNAESKSLKPWTGFPLERHNIGAQLEKGLLLGWIASRDKPMVEAFVSEADVSRLSIGQLAAVRVEYDADRTLSGSILSIGTEPIAFLPIEMGGDWYVMAQPDSDGRWIPETPMFRVVIRLDPTPLQLPLGGKATVRIETAPTTMAQQAYRFLRQTVFYRRQQAN
ncbi:MAG: hypothetical protein JNK90_20440 [Planctomycetaceae bacterium]|nr:hypothetical protein [Planctomycetaceae bacterium]